MKYNLRRILIIALFAVFIPVIAWSQVSPQAGVSLNIRYFDKRIYHLETDPILVQVTLSNNGTLPFRFKMADDRVFSVDFDVRTTTNRPVEDADILIRRRSQSRQVYFREILIEPGESYSFVEDLREYARINQSGVYVVQAKIYPELYYPENSQAQVARWGDTGNPAPIYSNSLSLTVRPPVIYNPDGMPIALDDVTNAALVRERLAPDEVIDYMLSARQKEQWEKFFLYLDLQEMYMRDAVRRRLWLAESEEGRSRLLARYKTELQAAVVDGDIATIPLRYNIERTEYGTEEGTVTVMEFFRPQGGSYTERKRFTYHMRKQEDAWTVIDFTVINLGTE